VEKVINIGTSMADAQEVVGLAGKHEFMFAAVGLHPNDDSKITVANIDWEEFEKLASQPKVVAIGECGLDYSRIPYDVLSITDTQEKDRQKKLFSKQIEIAQKLDLPLSIHLREAQEDLVSQFGESLHDLSGVFHCFSGDQQYLNFIINSLPNFNISFAGNITFKNAQPLRELIKSVPLDRLLLETDCPFLTPEPNRGKRNEPANVQLTAQTLADVKGLSFEEIAKITTENACALFKL
jgi:TatD DNase family protein